MHGAGSPASLDLVMINKPYYDFSKRASSSLTYKVESQKPE
jgi:hypothetical protein